MCSVTRVKLKGNMFHAFELTWDTEYFGCRSGKVVLEDRLAMDEWGSILDFMNDFDFVTIFNTGNNMDNNIWIGRETKGFLTDMNVQFVKHRSQFGLREKHASHVFEAYPYDEGILAIAQSAFKYSRFFNDPWLPPEKSKNIYAHWAKSAFYKMGRFFITIKMEERLAGFLLFSLNPDMSAVIELIAVDDIFSSCNIGKSLIARLESFLKDSDFQRIKVGTQINNIGSMGFYTSLGFSYQGCNSVFHYWPYK